MYCEDITDIKHLKTQKIATMETITQLLRNALTFILMPVEQVMMHVSKYAGNGYKT